MACRERIRGVASSEPAADVCNRCWRSLFIRDINAVTNPASKGHTFRIAGLSQRRTVAIDGLKCVYIGGVDPKQHVENQAPCDPDTALCNKGQDRHHQTAAAYCVLQELRSTCNIFHNLLRICYRKHSQHVATSDHCRRRRPLGVWYVSASLSCQVHVVTACLRRCLCLTSLGLR